MNCAIRADSSTNPYAFARPDFPPSPLPATYVWRRGSESNRRIRLLQSPALPLGYPATGLLTDIKSPRQSGKPLFQVAGKTELQMDTNELESGGEAFDGPGVVRLARITKAVVQPVGAALPEFDSRGTQHIPAPERRLGPVFVAVLFLVLPPFLFPFCTV